MKHLLIALILVALATFAYADDTTSGATWTTPYSPLTNWLNSNDIDHNHEYSNYDRGGQFGLGLDLVVYEFEGPVNTWGLDGVEVQQKYDFNNKEYQLYGVCKANLWRTAKKLLGLK